jgi:hypothetical protein
MTSSSNNMVHNRLNEISPTILPVSTNMVTVSSPASSIHKALSSNDSFDDFEQVENKKKHKRKRQPAASTRSLTNVVTPPVIPPAPVAVVPLLQNVVTNESTRYAQNRCPFPPFNIRLNAGKVTSNQVKEGLIEHCKKRISNGNKYLKLSFIQWWF